MMECIHVDRFIHHSVRYVDRRADEIEWEGYGIHIEGSEYEVYTSSNMARFCKSPIPHHDRQPLRAVFVRVLLSFIRGGRTDCDADVGPGDDRLSCA